MHNFGNNAKRRISKRRLQENKASQIFRKTNISYPLIRTLTYAYQGVKNVHFMKIWRALFSCYIRFEISLFALLPTMTDLVRNTELPQIIWVNKHFHRQYTCIEICEINIIKIEWMKVACIFFWDKNGL